jgi:hypothetical protein
MFDFVFNPLRSILRGAEHEVEEITPVQKTEQDILATVQAVERATDSIEHHVEVIERLATSVDPLKDSVNNLTATMRDLVNILGPIAAAEHEAHGVERFFGRHHEQPDAVEQHPD